MANWRVVWHYILVITGVKFTQVQRLAAVLFIDHGMGVVIGETAIVGDNVTLFHQVTLGGMINRQNAINHRTKCSSVQAQKS